MGRPFTPDDAAAAPVSGDGTMGRAAEAAAAAERASSLAILLAMSSATFKGGGLICGGKRGKGMARNGEKIWLDETRIRQGKNEVEGKGRGGRREGNVPWGYRRQSRRCKNRGKWRLGRVTRGECSSCRGYPSCRGPTRRAVPPLSSGSPLLLLPPPLLLLPQCLFRTLARHRAPPARRRGQEKAIHPTSKRGQRCGRVNLRLRSWTSVGALCRLRILHLSNVRLPRTLVSILPFAHGPRAVLGLHRRPATPPFYSSSRGGRLGSTMRNGAA